MWARITAFFHGSETIFWARVQQALGAIAVSLTYVDPSLLQPVFGDNVWGFSVFMLGNGIATEYLRRRRDPDMR